MKRLKLPLIIVGCLLALVLIVVMLAFTSGVQTWATRKALAGQPQLKGEVGSVAAGLTSAEIRDVHVEQDGIKISARQVDAAYSASDYLSGKKITVSRLSAKGIEIDARNPSPKAPAPPPAAAALAPFAGILNAIRLPGETRLGTIDVEAKVLLPNNQSATFTLTGGGLAPGQFATLNWKATFADATKGAPLVSAVAAGVMKVRTTADLRIDAVELTGEASAVGPGIPADRLKIELNLAQPAANAAETALARIFLLRGGAATATPEQLFNVKVDYAAGKPTMSGAWDLAVRSEQLAAVLASLGLPEVALTGKGTFGYNLDTGAASTAGEINGEVSRLDKLGAELAAIGSVKIRTAFDGASSKESAQLGKLEFDVATADGRKFITVAAQQKLSFNFKDKKLTPERPGAELARIALIAVPLAWAQPVVKPRTISGDLSGVFVVNAELDGSRVKLTAAEPLTLRTVTLKEGDKPLVDRVTLSVSPSIDYAPPRIVANLDKLAITTPEGDTLTGTLGANVTLPPTTIAIGSATGADSKLPGPVTEFTAQLQGKLVALTKPYLPAEVGPLTVAVNAKGRHDGVSVQIATLTTKVDREGGVALVALEALQPITLDLAKQQPSVPNAAAPALRVKWGTIPLVWAQGYVAKSKFAGELSAGTIEVVMLGADAAQVRALENISARGVSVAMDNQEFLRGADFSTDLNATWKAGTLTADIKQLELRQGTLSVLKASVSGDVTPPAAGKTLRAVGRGQLDADFSVLAKQPALAAQLPLLRGTVAVKFDGTYADGAKGKVTIAAKDLVAREGALALGSMDLSVDAALDANNSGTVRNALVVTKEGRRSDILLDGKVGMKPGAISFEGRITGDQLIVDDLQAFSALGAPPPPTAASLAKSPTLAPAPAPRPAATTAPRPAATAAAKPAGPVKDTTPIWAGFTGRVDVNVKTIKQGTANTITSVLGGFSVREDRLAAESLSFQLNGNSFKAATILSFDVKQARPYALVGTFDVPKFDVGAYLHKADPNVPPALETTITIASKFNGTAANLEEFADRIVGQFELKGSKGVLRALNKKAEQSSMALGLGGLAAGLLGQQKIADGLVGAAELAALLKDIQFDGITVQADRSADGVATVRKIEIIAPTLRLTGSGHIEAKKPGGEFGDCPLSFELQLAGKDRLAEGLNKARQLSGKTDEKGYYLMATPFTLGGTVSKPDSSSFWKNLTLNTGAGFLR